MPKYTELKPLKDGIDYKKQMLHLNKKEWDRLLFISNMLKMNDFSSVIKECLIITQGILIEKTKNIALVQQLMREKGIKRIDIPDT